MAFKGNLRVSAPVFTPRPIKARKMEEGNLAFETGKLDEAIKLTAVLKRKPNVLNCST